MGPHCASYNTYIYKDEYSEDCNETEWSYAFLVLFIGLFMVIVIAAIIAIILTFNYKKKYYMLAEQSEIKEATNSILNAFIFVGPALKMEEQSK